MVNNGKPNFQLLHDPLVCNYNLLYNQVGVRCPISWLEFYLLHAEKLLQSNVFILDINIMTNYNKTGLAQNLHHTKHEYAPKDANM